MWVYDKLGLKKMLPVKSSKYGFCQYMWQFSQGHSSEGQFVFGCRHCGMFALKDWLFYSYNS